MPVNIWRVLAVGCFACGAASFLMLLPGAAGWAGIALAALALALGWRGCKNEKRDVRFFSILGTVLAVAAALANLVLKTGIYAY